MIEEKEKHIHGLQEAQVEFECVFTPPKHEQPYKVKLAVPTSYREAFHELLKILGEQIEAETKIPCPYCGSPLANTSAAALAFDFKNRLYFKHKGDLNKMLEAEVLSYLTAEETKKGEEEAAKLRKEISETEKWLSDLASKGILEK